jgi:hypothetical protein
LVVLVVLELTQHQQEVQPVAHPLWVAEEAVLAEAMMPYQTL